MQVNGKSGSVDGRKKGVSDKKKRNQPKIDLTGSVERIGGHKFSISGYHGTTTSFHHINLAHEGSNSKPKA